MHIRLALVEAINGFNDLRQVSSPAMASFIVIICGLETLLAPTSLLI